MKEKISRRLFIESTAKAGLMIGASIGMGNKRIFASYPHFDLIIKNGLIVDGVNNEPFKSDLGIISGRIAELGNLNSTDAKSVVDAAGKMVTPGFIDIHSHSDSELLINPKAESKIRQGITTELGGNCGHCPFPREKTLSSFEKEWAEELNLDSIWTDLEGYHAEMEKRGIAVNHATLVGQGTVRQLVMGDARRKPTAGEMDVMRKLVAEAMSQGAFGLSTGLEYIPDRFSSTEEIVELCKVVAQAGGFYSTHIRSEDIHLMEAIAEAIHIAESAQLPLQISHLKAAGKENYYKVPLVFDLMERAKQRGVELTADRYPYTAYSTTLNIMYPVWALAGGPVKFAERLQDKDLRQKMKEEALKKVEGNNSWKNMLISSVSNEDNKHLVGKYIQEAADEKKQEPYEFACDLLTSEGGGLNITGFGMSEENTEKILKHPLVMLCSDGRALAPYGFLDRGIPHPRNYGAFPRFLGTYIREKKLLSLPEAIKKMPSMPAAKMGLKKRGTIKRDNYADLVVFNLSKIVGKATFVRPKQYPDGIDYVIVNGKVVVDHGTHTGELPGKVLHRA